MQTQNSLTRDCLSEVSPESLYDAELAALPTIFCVTGATGFLGAHIVKRLLEAGHTVHAVARDCNHKHRFGHLCALAGADRRLRVFKADVLQPDGLIKAAVGCEYIIHCAGPMVTQVPKSKVHSLLVSPYVKATENVLAAATAARVKKVIYTSGVNAATANNTEFGKNHIMTEEDWNVMASEDYMPLSYAKRLAEQRAWQLYDSQSQDHRWELITILPGFLLGPPVIPSSSPSIQFCLDMLHGKFARSMPPLGIATVDVRDAAAAHVLAALLPRAKGRYLCLQRHTNIIEVIKDIQPRWPHKLVGPATPKWLLKGVANLTTLITWDRVVAQYGTVLKFDCSKIVRDLGLKFHSASEALHAMGKRLVQMDMCETIQISNIQ